MRLKSGWATALLAVMLVMGCGDNASLPREAQKHVPMQLVRFEQAFFALDTNHLEASLDTLSQRYPAFFPGFLTAVLGIVPQDPQAAAAIRAFLQSYRPVYGRANAVAEKHLPATMAHMESALQWLQYLVPSFTPDSPFVVTTFVGPMDAFERFSTGDYGDVRTSNGVGIALQLHLGAQEPLYESGMQGGLFYPYQVRRFTPETMAVNAMRQVVDDFFPYSAAGRPLVEEMVEKGKRIYLLRKIMPAVPDSLILGYTGAQVTGCLENEGLIWSFFVKNDLLYSVDASINQLYLKDGPKTPELGEASPGYIALFTGWRIVEAYMDKQKDKGIEALMKTPPGKVLEESGYRPK